MKDLQDLYGEPTYKAEDLKRLYLGCYQIWVNQGWRHAMVLAILEDEALIEYEMPNGSTSLRIVPLMSDLEGAIEMATGNTWRSISYWRVPLKWLCEMVRTGETWIGSPQQSTFFVPSPAELLAERT